jgi:pyruvate/2-oxoglutarate dehydrogenase complex dihydrolipoamide acyltransferase (E2) component
MSTEAPYFGIDFGTTNSSMAWCDPKTGRAEPILNEEGEEKTPSVVYFGEDEIIVGEYAEEKLKEVENSTNPEERDDVSQRIVRSIKRNLLDPPVIPLPGREPVRPVEVVAHILGKLKHDAEEEHFNEEVERVVVTCPATFDTQQQQVLLEGAAMAGFRRVELLEEPTAAALTVTKVGQRVGKGLVIYDLGAGTFDLSVVVRDSEDSPFYLPREPQGDPQCGGDDLDLALYYYCDGLALEELGRHISPTEGIIDLVFLRDCRSRKHNLSKGTTSIFSSYLSSDNGPQQFRQKVDRKTFEDLIRPRIEGTVKMTAKLWDQVKDQVDAVVLIGGSSRVPLVRQRLEEALKVEPRGFAGKDYAVALGAAYKAYELWIEEPGTVTDEAPEIKEYRRALKSCWNNRWLTRHEVEWLAELAKQELKLNSEVAARVERQVMDDTIEGVLAAQEPIARDRYATVLQRGWRDQKLDALRRIPSVRLDMLLKDQDRFCDFPFADSPVSPDERKEMASGLPWWVFVMAARVVTAPELSTAAVVSGLDAIADELGLSKDQAAAVDREVLGSTIGSALKRQEKVVRDRYRKAVEEASKKGISRARITYLNARAGKLGLSKDQTEAIERKIMGNTASGILAEDKMITELIKQHSLVRSRIEGSGKNGRITKRDVEAYIKEQERLSKLRSKLRSNLDKHGNKFVTECQEAAKKIMGSDSNWQNNLGNCVEPALKAYATGVQKEAQAEVAKLRLGLTVPAFPTPKLSVEITAGEILRDNTAEKVGKGAGGAAAGAVTGAGVGALVGSIIPVVGTGLGAVVGGVLGAGGGVSAATEDVSDYKSTPDRVQSLKNVRTATQKLRPALKKEAQKYLDRVENAVAATQEQATGTAQQATGQAGGAAAQATDAASQTAGGDGADEPKATNAARRKAEELGVDLSQLKGSGAGGLITIKDVVGS